MDQYFGRMKSLMTNPELPSRIRFLLQDTMELRENGWAPRKAFTDNGPKTITQIRQDAIKVSPRVCVCVRMPSMLALVSALYKL